MYDAAFSIIICTKNRVDFLRDTVRAIGERLKCFANARIIVVDNGSTDNTSHFLREFSNENSNVLAIYEPTPGLYHARVRGLAHATGEIIIFIDDDVLPGNNWPDGLLQELLHNPTIGVVGTAIDPIWEGPRPSWMTDRFTRDIPIFSIPNGYQLYKFPSYPPGVCLALRVRGFLELYAASERRTVQLGWGAQNAPGTSAFGGDDWDLSELYIRNNYLVVSIDHVRVWHRIVPEKLSQARLLEKFESDGRLRIRYARLAGYSIFSSRVIILLASFPVLAIGAVIVRLFGLSGPKSLTIQAYARRAKGTVTELLWGMRGIQFPFNAAGASGTPNQTEPRLAP